MYILNTQLLRQLPSLLNISVKELIKPLDISQTSWYALIASSKLRLTTIVTLCNYYHIPLSYLIIDESNICAYNSDITCIKTGLDWKGDISLRIERLPLIYKNHIGGCTRQKFFEEVGMLPASYSHNIHTATSPTIRVITLLNLCNKFHDDPFRIFDDPNLIPTIQSVISNLHTLESRINFLEQENIKIKTIINQIFTTPDAIISQLNQLFDHSSVDIAAEP